MLKALALTLAVATLLASGLALAPAKSVSPGSRSLARTGTMTMEKLLITSGGDEKIITSQSNTSAKAGREVIPVI